MTTDRIFEVSLEQIEVPRNIRGSINPARVHAMARSMKAKGQLHPADIVPGSRKPYSLIDGVHRYEGKRLLGELTLLCHLREKPFSDGERIEHQLIANALRFDVGVMDKARAIAELIDRTALTFGEVADRIGMSNGGVTKTLKLLTLAEKVQQYVENGLLAWSTAYEITPLEDQAAQIEVADMAVSRRLTRDAVIELVKQRLSAGASTPNDGGADSATDSHTGGEPVSAARMVRRFKATLGDVGITASATPLTRENFVEALAVLLAAARKLQARGVADETFFQSLPTEVTASRKR